MTATVVAVHARRTHTFSKDSVLAIELVEGHGVRGDAHFGATIKHRSRVARDATQPNLRQVHLLHCELFEELAGRGLRVHPGQMGENVTTRGIDLLGLDEGTVLRLGPEAQVWITGLRNPCAQIEAFMPGLLKAVLGRDERGAVVRKAGVMGVVLRCGFVSPGDAVAIEARSAKRAPLRAV
ncbi:MAG: MOSC domain-containing protein [Burkholderiales bacterium]